MKRRDFIKGLLSLPFVGYVASKLRKEKIERQYRQYMKYALEQYETDRLIYGDGVALFNTSHPVKDSAFYPAGGLSDQALEETMMEVIKHKGRFKVRMS